MATVVSGGLAHVRIWSKAETLQKRRTDFISQSKWLLLNTEQLWPLVRKVVNRSYRLHNPKHSVCFVCIFVSTTQP